MEATLNSGDVILLKKINFISAKKELKAKARALIQNRSSVNNENTDSTNIIDRNDIAVFKWKERDNQAIIKRCIALPGEEIFIDSSVVFINNMSIEEPGTVLHLYQIKNLLFNKHKSSFNSLELYVTQRDSEIIYAAPNFLIDSLCAISKNLTSGKYVEIECTGAGDYCFNADEKWTIDFFGPLTIPKKGMHLKLDSLSVKRYSKTINIYENSTITWENSRSFVNDSAEESYIFKKNYYFFLGDNRNNSNDSRYIGFIPEDELVGTTRRVLISYGKDGVDWARLLLKVN